MSPVRIQRKRAAGWRLADHVTSPLDPAYVGRPTRFANPARLIRVDHGQLIVRWDPNGVPVGTWPPDGIEARRYATELYRNWITQPEQADTRTLFRALLRGRDLTCWCPVPATGQPDHCHAAVLLELANEENPS